LNILQLAILGSRATLFVLNYTSALRTLTVLVVYTFALRAFTVLRMFDLFHALRALTGLIMFACALWAFAILTMLDFFTYTFCTFTICIMFTCAFRTFAILTMFQYAHCFSTRTLIAFFFVSRYKPFIEGYYLHNYNSGFLFPML
jgi:hypothetical protein